jgi:iron complex transport system permease protein
LFYFYLFRDMLAFLVGSALALSGAVFQGIFRNPLADPYILGISSGAAVGAAAVFVLAPAVLLAVLVPAGALSGALAALALVLLISGSGSTEKLLLSGVVTGVIVSSVLICLVSFSNSEQLAGVTWWILGDLQGGNIYSCSLLAAVDLSCLVLFRFFANDLNALALGDDDAALRGVPVRKVRFMFVFASSLLASLCVSLAGIIGFAGLIVPHITRLSVGSDHRKNLLPVFFSGGIFLLICDLIARLLSVTREIPVGVVTSCIGGGIFLYLLARSNRRA